MSDEGNTVDGPNMEGADGDEQLVERIVEKISPNTRDSRVELVLTVMLAMAAVLTAWAALQSAKWSGEQAIHFNEAGANRTESTRFDSRATSAILLDTQTFLQWAQAIGAETSTVETVGESPADPTVFEPSAASLSGYLFTQFREEFRPRALNWIEGGGPVNPAGSSPFFPFEDYLDESVPAAAEAERLAAVAEERAAVARQDNQNSDDYVVTVVLLASVLFFAGVSSKMRTPRSQTFLLVVSAVVLGWACIRLVTLPIHAIP